MAIVKRLWPIGLLAALAAGFYAVGLQNVLSFEALGEQQATLQQFVADQPIAAPLAYMAAYAAVVGLSVPVSALMSVAAGVLFGLVAGRSTPCSARGAGSIMVFLLARYVLGDLLARRAGGLLERVRPGLERDGFSYLLALRLLPVVRSGW